MTNESVAQQEMWGALKDLLVELTAIAKIVKSKLKEKTRK